MPEKSLDERGVLPRFDRHLAITTRSDEPGACTAELALAPEHRNIEGRIHGGVLLTLLDTAMGHAIASLAGVRETVAGAATMQFSCQFLNAPAGQILYASGKVSRLGRSSAFIEGVLRDDRGTEVARAHGVWRVWRLEERRSP
jgi:uncharacterized protein (TIGR00369 family)